jgi:PAS domain S-box-containing protein
MQLRSDETYYRQLFDALDQGFCTIEVLFDDRGTANDYRFIDVNTAFEQQTGLHDAMGRRVRELVPAHEEHWFRIYGEIARTGTPVRFEQEAAALQRWYDVYAFRVGAAGENLVGVLFDDIRRRKQTEQALEAARRAADLANRSKDEFIAMLAHELRNPLAPMVTALQLMRLRGVASREQEVLERQVQHLTRMVDDLLDVSRFTTGKIDLKRQPTELRHVVLRAMELSGAILEQRRHFVEVSIPHEGAGIDVDVERMSQVISNLLNNGSKYSDEGSRISISGGRHADVVRISVKDAGIGLEPSMLDTVFEPFVQESQSVAGVAGGLGLGLAIVRKLVAAHGGTVHATSAGRNQGSEFIVELPAVDLP